MSQNLQGNRESLNKRLLPRVIFYDKYLSFICNYGAKFETEYYLAFCNCMDIAILTNFIKTRLTEKSSDLRLVLFKGQASKP